MHYNSGKLQCMHTWYVLKAGKMHVSSVLTLSFLLLPNRSLREILLCSLGCPWTNRAACLYLLGVGIKGAHHYAVYLFICELSPPRPILSPHWSVTIERTGWCLVCFPLDFHLSLQWSWHGAGALTRLINKPKRIVERVYSAKHLAHKNHSNLMLWPDSLI